MTIHQTYLFLVPMDRKSTEKKSKLRKMAYSSENQSSADKTEEERNFLQGLNIQSPRCQYDNFIIEFEKSHKNRKSMLLQGLGYKIRS